MPAGRCLLPTYEMSERFHLDPNNSDQEGSAPLDPPRSKDTGG